MNKPALLEPTALLVSLDNANCSTFSFAGQKFAQYEIKTVITKILTNFEVFLGDEQFKPTLLAELVLKSGNGLPLKLRPRQH